MNRRTLATAAALTASAALLAACGGGAAALDGDGASTARDNATPTPTPIERSHLSGRAEPDGRVLVVKLDNSRAALPHTGLTSADLVYVQQVEGGISRLAAVYSTRIPDEVAPVRSARETDAQLLPQLGDVPVGFSGSIRTVHQQLTNAGLLDVSADVGPKGYSRVGWRSAPHDLAADPAALLERAPGSPKARDMGWTFGAAPKGGSTARTVTATMPAARVSFTYSSKTGRYAVALDGIPDRTKAEGQVAASTVIIQSVDVWNLDRRDSSGALVPYTRTVGEGRALVIRDGKAWGATWSRPSVDKSTRFTIKGKDVPLKSGQVWVVLLDEDRRPSVR